MEGGDWRNGIKSTRHSSGAMAEDPINETAGDSFTGWNATARRSPNTFGNACNYLVASIARGRRWLDELVTDAAASAESPAISFASCGR
jgi:hypothetical protein